MTNPYPDYEEREEKKRNEARKREDSNKTRNGRGDITTDATKVKIVRQLWAIIHQQIEQPRRSGLISETYNLLRRNRKLEQTNDKFGDWISNQKSPNKENPGPNSFTGELYQIFK